nr:WPE palindromic element domain-containing protein [Wolbachia pipientis]
MHQNHNFITINIVAALHFWTILVPIFYGVIDITKNASSFLEKFVIFMAVTDSHFLWHIFSSTVKWLFIMNFVSNCQFFSLERCNKAHWDPEKLIVHYTTFSIKSWIPVSSTGMTSQGHWNFCFNICTLAMHLNRYCKLAILH